MKKPSIRPLKPLKRPLNPPMKVAPTGIFVVRVHPNGHWDAAPVPSNFMKNQGYPSRSVSAVEATQIAIDWAKTKQPGHPGTTYFVLGILAEIGEPPSPPAFVRSNIVK